ncbi:MAG: PilZ domain-containing protein [Vicinamibacterales bacterium]
MPHLAVLVAATELQPALVARVAGEGLEWVTFTEADALRALQTITSRKPQVVALETGFAATARGKALVNRIKADPALAHITLRLESPDETAVAQPADTPPTPEPEAAPPSPAVQLDFTGTRRAPRHAVDESREILVDGKPGSLVNLSLVGVQLVTTAALKPGQRVRVSLTEPKGALRCGATVVWATFEMTKNGPRYRVGLDFINPNTAALDGYIGRLERKHA